MRPSRRLAHASLVSLLASSLGACQPNPPPAEQNSATPPAAPDPPRVADPPANSSDPPPEPLTRHPPSKRLSGKQLPEPVNPDPAAAPSAAASYTRGPVTAAALASGALLVWSRHDAAANKSEILAQRLDDRGNPRDTPRLVRRTSGNVLDLAVDRRDGAAWIAWVAQLAAAPDLPRALVAAVRVEPDLSAMRPPVTLHQFVAQDLDAWPERDLLALRALADGGAAIASASSSAECLDIVTDRKTKCPGFDVHWLTADGAHTLAGKVGADGGDPGIGDLVDVGTGVLFDVWAWHGGATHATLYAPYHQPAAEPPLPIHHCRPGFTRAWTGAELVTICPDDYSDGGCPGGSVSTEPDACTRVHTAIKGNKSVPLQAEQRRCVDDHPVVDLRSKAGKLRLDPAAPGASIDLDLGVWTGTHALQISEGGLRDLWTCNKSELVAADAPGDALALDPDPTSLKSIPTRSP